MLAKLIRYYKAGLLTREECIAVIAAWRADLEQTCVTYPERAAAIFDHLFFD